MPRDQIDELSELSMFGELREAILCAFEHGNSFALYMHALEHLKSAAVQPLKYSLFLEMSWRRLYKSGLMRGGQDDTLGR